MVAIVGKGPADGSGGIGFRGSETKLLEQETAQGVKVVNYRKRARNQKPVSNGIGVLR
jgi:hypothetical protein